ncbi:MAG TPA: hypothetical protein PLH56_03045 [Candidatus Omnitrophota bacterium]|nr:hypothetical protein [Candidatus Omnitrophota bacterium]
MFKIYQLIIYSGILAFIGMLLAFGAIFFEDFFYLHQIGGILAIIFSFIHVGLVIYREFKRRGKQSAVIKKEVK